MKSISLTAFAALALIISASAFAQPAVTITSGATSVTLTNPTQLSSGAYVFGGGDLAGTNLVLGQIEVLLGVTGDSPFVVPNGTDTYSNRLILTGLQNTGATPLTVLFSESGFPITAFFPQTTFTSLSGQGVVTSLTTPFDSSYSVSIGNPATTQTPLPTVLSNGPFSFTTQYGGATALNINFNGDSATFSPFTNNASFTIPADQTVDSGQFLALLTTTGSGGIPEPASLMTAAAITATTLLRRRRPA